MPEKFKFTNVELSQLAAEASAFLTLKLKIDVKYKVTKLLEQVNGLIRVYQEFNNNTVEELGLIGAQQYVEIDGKQVLNPFIVQYNEKMKPLNEEVQEFEFKLLPFDWIKNIETEMNFPLLYRFFEITEEK